MKGFDQKKKSGRKLQQWLRQPSYDVLRFGCWSGAANVQQHCTNNGVIYTEVFL